MFVHLSRKHIYQKNDISAQLVCIFIKCFLKHVSVTVSSKGTQDEAILFQTKSINYIFNGELNMNLFFKNKTYITDITEELWDWIFKTKSPAQ